MSGPKAQLMQRTGGERGLAAEVERLKRAKEALETELKLLRMKVALLEDARKGVPRV